MQQMDDLYRQYATPVYRFLLSMTRDADLAEELTQETFYQAVKSIHRYDGSCKMLVWLCQIGKHCYYDALKRRRRSAHVDLDTLAESAPHADTAHPADRLIAGEQVAALYRTIHALPDPYKELLLLRLSGELSFREIGEIMGRSENWARVTFYRAKTKLVERMKDDE